jgi:hypothetical protein
MTERLSPIVIVYVVASTNGSDGCDLRVHPEDLHAIREAVTSAVEDRLDADVHVAGSGGFNSTAADIAARHGVTPAWVRTNADLLGGVRIGSGSKPRLRFNVETVDARITAMGRSRNDRPAINAPTPRKSRPRASQTKVALLPIKGRTHT